MGIKNISAQRKKKKLSGWDKAIADAKRTVRGLEYAIAVYREQKRQGVPWPGESATRN